jgi:DNA end-binding protein Ku
MKALWKGYIALGQIGIPARIFAATQDQRLKFVKLHDKDYSPIERKTYCKREQQEISSKDTIRGIEFEPGKYITFTNQELEKANKYHSKTIQIRQFCEPNQIPFVYYDKSYYIVASKGGEYAYVLLREGLSRTGLIAITQFYYYGAEYIGALEPLEDILILHRLRYSDELVPRSAIKTPAVPQLDPKEIDMMQTIMQRYSSPVHLRDYHNEYEEQIKLLCEQKAKGKTLPADSETVSAEATPANEVSDILVNMLDQNPNLIHKTYQNNKPYILFKYVVPNP